VHGYALTADWPPSTTLSSHCPTTGDPIGTVTIHPDGRETTTCAGGILATHPAICLLRGDAWTAESVVTWRHVTIVRGAQYFSDVAARYRYEALIGVSRWTPELRAALRARIPAGWALLIAEDSLVAEVLR
jgi:hypothetical protein